jgi:hypothetical protein
VSEPQIDWNASLRKTWLPARAFLMSWPEQTVPARRAAIDEALELHQEAVDAGDLRLADMALLGVVGDSMQALEDLAYLGTAWDSPFTGVPQYVRATAYGPTTAQTFWQEARKKWDDDRIEVFAGLAMRDPASGRFVRTHDIPGTETAWTTEQRAAFDEIASVTVAKIRRLLDGLFRDWEQFAAYFQAYKHGGLAVNRADVFFIADDVADEDVDEHTPRHHPSICVWTRGGRKQELVGDFDLDAAEAATYAAGSGRLALRMIEQFVSMRLWIFDSLIVGDDGSISGYKDVQLPMTDWLREGDLSAGTLEAIGRGPWLRQSTPDGEAGESSTDTGT